MQEKDRTNCRLISSVKLRAKQNPQHADEIWKRRFHSENASNFFPSTLRRGSLNKQQSPVIWFVFEESSVNFQRFSSTRKRGKGGFFKFLRIEERFRKPPFSFWRISVDGKPQ